VNGWEDGRVLLWAAVAVGAMGAGEGGGVEAAFEPE
jgi:hypothetical protein